MVSFVLKDKPKKRMGELSIAINLRFMSRISLDSEVYPVAKHTRAYPEQTKQS